jgi:hypothetical protein
MNEQGFMAELLYPEYAATIGNHVARGFFVCSARGQNFTTIKLTSLQRAVHTPIAAGGRDAVRPRAMRSTAAIAGRGLMLSRAVVLKVLCAAMVGCLVLPLGSMLSPYVEIPILAFNAIEAVVSATVGFSIAELLG